MKGQLGVVQGIINDHFKVEKLKVEVYLQMEDAEATISLSPNTIVFVHSMSLSQAGHLLPAETWTKRKPLSPSQVKCSIVLWGLIYKNVVRFRHELGLKTMSDAVLKFNS